MKNVAVLTEDGAFALFFRPHPGGFDSSRVPAPGNLPSQAKKLLMPGGQPGGVLGAGGIDWCITQKTSVTSNRPLSTLKTVGNLYITQRGCIGISWVVTSKKLFSSKKISE